MKNQVITVRRNQKLGEVIKNLVFDEKILYMIYIDKELIDFDMLEEYLENSHKLSQEGYDIIIGKGEGTSKDWLLVWDCFYNHKEEVYTLYNVYLYDYIEGHCCCKNIYIRKWGSKTKIDEE